MKTYKFRDYLLDQFRDWYQGWDDSGPDAEARWYSELSDKDLIEYFTYYMYERWWQVTPVDWNPDTGKETDHHIKFIHSLL